ncbi:MAG: hypothetical protein WCD63_03560, partial [Terrimicrobiaceae bacterium]
MAITANISGTSSGGKTCLPVPGNLKGWAAGKVRHGEALAHPGLFMSCREDVEIATSGLFRVKCGNGQMKIYLDGEFCDKEDAKVSVFDHGLLYGDGVFEGIRFYHGKV